MTCNEVALFWLSVGSVFALFGLGILAWHIIYEKR
jgi:hypothetical protein